MMYSTNIEADDAAVTVMPAPQRQPKDVAVASSDVLALVSVWHGVLEEKARLGEIADETALKYKVGMRKFLEWVEAHGNLSNALVKHWVMDLRTAYKPATVRVWFAGVRAFCDWAEGEGYLVANPTRGVSVPQRLGFATSHVREPLTDDEVRRLMQALPQDDSLSALRDRALVLLMLYTGLRQVETHRANVKDLKHKGGRWLLYVHGKGRQEADEFVVLARERPKQALQQYLEKLNAELGKAELPVNALFVSVSDRSFGKRLSRSAIRRMVKGYFHAAGIVEETKTTHSLRHTVGAKFVEKGVQIERAQSVFRHRYRASTEVYSHERDRLTHPAEEEIEYD